MEKIEIDNLDVSKLSFQFPNPMQCGKIIFKSDSLNKSYDEKKVINNLNLDIYNGDRIAFVGKNGCGKTTQIDEISKWLPKKTCIEEPDVWIELIPFKETRNYVQRVMENIQVYEFIENGLKPIEYTLSNNLNRAYVGGKTLIKPSKKKDS